MCNRNIAKVELRFTSSLKPTSELMRKVHLVDEQEVVWIKNEEKINSSLSNCSVKITINSLVLEGEKSMTILGESSKTSSVKRHTVWHFSNWDEAKLYSDIRKLSVELRFRRSLNNFQPYWRCLEKKKMLRRESFDLCDILNDENLRSQNSTSWMRKFSLLAFLIFVFTFFLTFPRKKTSRDQKKI